jgi:MFS family permease
MNELTDSNAWVGAVAFAAFFPSFLVTPLAGILSDRIDRRTVLIVAYTIQSIVALAFTLMYAADLLTPWRIMVLVLLSGVAAGFQWAPIQAMAAVLVPRSLLIYGVRLVSISFTAGRTVGPALAALILAFAGPGLAYVVTLVLYLAGLALVASLHTGWQPGDVHEPFMTQFTSGVRYVFSSPSIRLAVALSFIIAAFAAVYMFALTASVADDAFDAGGGGVGALAAMAGVGSIIGSIYIVGPGGRVLRSRLELVAVGLYIVGLLVVAATSALWVGLIGYVVIGLGHMLHGVTLNTTIQMIVEEEYRGRVMSVWLMGVLGGLPVGALLAGALADVVGIQTVMLGSTLVIVILVGTLAIATRGLKPLDA